MMPTIVRASDPRAAARACVPCSSGWNMRLPTASPLGQNFRASRSSIDDHPRPSSTSPVVEEAAGDEPRPHRFEVAVGDRHLARRDHRLARRHLVALGQDHAVAVVAAERERGRQAGGLDTGDRAHRSRSGPVTLRSSSSSGVARWRQADRPGQHVVGPEARDRRRARAGGWRPSRRRRSAASTQTPPGW